MKGHAYFQIDTQEYRAELTIAREDFWRHVSERHRTEIAVAKVAEDIAAMLMVRLGPIIEKALEGLKEQGNG